MARGKGPSGGPTETKPAEAPAGESKGSTFKEKLKEGFGDFASGVGQGFLDKVLGKTLAGSITNSGKKSTDSGARETGKQSPLTGDTGKDVVNAVRDLQSDLNAQTGVLRQTNDILDSQSRVMSQGFGAMASGLNALGRGMQGMQGGGNGGSNSPFSFLGDALDLFSGKKPPAGAPEAKASVAEKPERYQWKEKAGRWVDTEKGLGGGSFMSDAEAEAQGLLKGGKKAPSAAAGASEAGAGEGMFSKLKSFAGKAGKGISEGVEAVGSAASKVASKAALPLLAAAACWEAYQRIKDLDPADPDYKKNIAKEVSALVARFGITTVATMLGTIAAGVVSGPGAIVGFVAGLGAGLAADYMLGDSVEEVVKSLVDSLWPGGAAPVYQKPERLTHAEGVANASGAQFDASTGAKLSAEQVKKRDSEAASAAQGAPIYDAMGTYTGMNEPAVDRTPSLQQQDAGRNKMSDKKVPEGSNFHYSHFGIKDGGTNGTWDFYEKSDIELARKFHASFEKGDIDQPTMAAAFNAIQAGENPYEMVPQLRGGRKQESKKEAAPGAASTAAAAGTGKTAAMQELADKEKAQTTKVDAAKAQQERDRKEYEAKQEEAVALAGLGVDTSTDKRLQEKKEPTSPEQMKAKLNTLQAPPRITSGGGQLPRAPTAPPSAAAPEGPPPPAAGAAQAPSVGGAAARKEARDAGVTPAIAGGLTPIKTKSGKTAQVGSMYAKNFQGFIDDLEATGYKIDSIGGYANRSNVNNPSVKSYHAMGAAIDINPGRNPNKSTQTDLPPETGALAAKHGLGWGMNWKSVKDPMHFSAARGEQGSFDIPRGVLGQVASGEVAGGAASGGGGGGAPAGDKKKDADPVGAMGGGGGGAPRVSGSPLEQAQALGAKVTGGISGMLGGGLTSKESKTLAGAMGPPQSMAPVSSAAATRDAAGMTPPASGKETPTINTAYNTQKQGGEGREPNKVESALPSAQIFHELFGIGAGGKGSTSYGG